MRRLQIGVVGSAGPEEYPFAKPLESMRLAAEELGSALAKNGCIVINGGKGGIMTAVAKGAKNNGGFTAAEVSGTQRFTSNRYIDVEIVTGDEAFRGPSQLVAMSDAVISLGGGAGTLQELCVAYRMRKPIILIRGYGGWTDKLVTQRYLDERKLVPFVVVSSPQQATYKALTLLQYQKGKS